MTEQEKYGQTIVPGPKKKVFMLVGDDCVNEEQMYDPMHKSPDQFAVG